MKRQKVSREFKFEAVVSEPRHRWRKSVANRTFRRTGKWLREFGSDSVQAFPSHGQMSPEQQEIERLRHDVAKLLNAERHS